MAVDVHLLQIFMNVGGQFAENIMAFQGLLSSSTTPATDSLALITAWEAGNEALHAGCLAADAKIIGYKARRVNNTGGPTVAASRNISGARAGSVATSGVGPLLTFSYYYPPKTRWRAGKMFIAGMANDDYTDNAPVAGLVAALNDFKSALASSFGSGPSGPWNMVVWSRKQKLAYMPTTFTISGIEGTQRRRQKPTF